MGIGQALTQALMNRLPADVQARMASDLITWLCADLPQAERQEKLERLSPRLLARLRKGQFGLRLVLYYHLLRLAFQCWPRSSMRPAGIPAKGQLAATAPTGRADRVDQREREVCSDPHAIAGAGKQGTAAIR